jgi:hypothetical protein
MKQKKYFLHFRLYGLLIASLALTACGGGGGSDNTNTNSSKQIISSSSSLSSTSSVSSQSSSSSVVSSSETSSTTSSVVSSSSSSLSSQSSVSSVISSSSSSVIVVVDTVAPTISLGASSTNIIAATNFTLTATASDNVGVTKVEFYDGTNLISSDLTAPYAHTINLTASNNGTKTFKAIAYDAAGNATPTAGLTVTIDIDTTAPSSVNLVSSSSNISAAGSFTLTTTAVDNKAVSKVEFYDGTTLLGTDTVSPFTYSVSVTSAHNGTKNYTSKAFDEAGNSTVSNAVNVVINIDTGLPTVSLSSSSLNVTSAGSITLTATATDNVGVSKVEFYDGTTLLNTDTSSPFAYVINFNTNFTGSKNYTAKAYDVAGNTATSSAVTVNISVNVDSIAPMVVSATPANNTTDVATTTPITVTFSEAMKTDSVTGTLIVSDYPNGTNPVSQTFTATFSSDSKVATLSVAGGYQRGKVYQFDINAKDLAGNLMAATYPLTISMQQVFAGIYTAKNGTGTSVKVAVEYYPLNASGNPTPTRKLEGSDTTINDWKRLVIDSKANMYISTPTGIAVFRATDYGNVVPRQRMTGSNTGLTNPTALGLNSAETELFVLDQQNQSVSVFSATATGNVAPVRKISGVINNVKDMLLYGNEVFVLGGISSAPKIWVFNQSDNGTPTAKRVIDLPASHAAINYLYAYGDKLLAPYGNASYQFVVISTLATNTNGSGSFVMERYHSDMGRTTPGTIAPAMLAVAGSQLWVNDYGLIYKLDTDLSTVETGPATAQFSTTGNNTPFIFVVP